MSLHHHNLNRNMAQVRMVYFQEILSIVNKAPSKYWEDTCLDFLEDNNTLQKSESKKAFSFNGDYFPPSINKLRKSQIMKVSVPLHKDLEEEFEELRKSFVDDWQFIKRSFKNFLNRALSMAKTEAELSLVVPMYILEQVETVDFLPNPRATGLTQEAADKLLADFPQIKDIHKLSAIGKLT